MWTKGKEPNESRIKRFVPESKLSLRTPNWKCCAVFSCLRFLTCSLAFVTLILAALVHKFSFLHLWKSMFIYIYWQMRFVSMYPCICVYQNILALCSLCDCESVYHEIECKRIQILRCMCMHIYVCVDFLKQLSFCIFYSRLFSFHFIFNILKI